jgi:hypothetical protein
MSKLIVYHRGYGCDTGCCGHTVEWYSDETIANAGDDFEPYYYDSETDSDGLRNFEFTHPYGLDEADEADEAGRLRWAQKFVADVYGEEHVKDLDWEHSFVTDDC